jgi:hypothetical protein
MTGARSLRMLGVRTTLYGRTALLQAAPAEVRAAELASFLHLAPGVTTTAGTTDAATDGLRCAAELIGKCGHRRGRIASQEIVTATLFDGKATLLVTGIAGGADLQTVKERPGHGNVITTEKYLHTLAETDDTALTALAAIRARHRTSD